ncbi:4-phosphopantetheinyl transferase family protein [Pedobacter hiemivivus]|uniref:4-phosphopantetheinyl transferase family protein n=1 Tax=Pedobacter hiemivivus TaxID=2530454 RepID=A0A4R0MK41_9SPHI|nr:4'-phosphopantetheinyl transferase superfamily protein [Pedobacter hiemivivus]TCC86697.1 4-phosphopantetheinyl transferase family protein [Pedobacter hiemivivus]TKC62223.1 4-phosphopantetheinyl transferase family protein [Pedobacter hiemivivus]
MIGNDIVDLSQAAKESNWKRTGYLEKLFTMAERFLIHVAKDPEVMVWLLWTMKESAYKAHAKETKIRTFAPTLLCCTNVVVHPTLATGNVFYQGKMYYTQSTLSEAYIHTIASEKTKVLSSLQLKISDYDESDSAYRSTNPASVSHHGNYLALIYL